MTIAVLAIETATDACSVAVFCQNTLLEHFEIIPKLHTQRILPLINDVLSKSNLRLSDITVLAFGRGPGSFTGVRIATSIIQGLAYGASLPVIPISTLQALAQGAYRIYKSERVFAALDARQGEIYCNTYTLQEGVMQPTGKEQVINPEMLKEIEGTYIGVGSGCEVYRTLFEKSYPNIQIVEEGPHYPHAQDIATLAYHAYQKGEAVSAEQALPIYLRDKVVTEKPFH